MSAKYSPQRNRRKWLTKARDPAKSAFVSYFQGPDLWANENLWQIYREWHNMRREQDFETFRTDLTKMREEASKQVEEWPNPFKNGKKGESYSISFRLPACIQRYAFSRLEPINLSYTQDLLDPLLCTITGVPQQAGDFTIELRYIWKGWGKGQEIQKKELKIHINPDPREMWKDIPTDRNLEYFKYEYDCAEIESRGWRLLGASQRGRSHAHTGLPRDDDFALGCFNNWYMLVVADGAGSAPYSRYGSEMATDIALQTCKRQLANTPRLEEIFASALPDSSDWLPEARKLAYTILPQSAFEAYKAIRQEAQAKNREAKAYATTLLLALAKKFPAGWAVMSFQIGDGAMALISKDGSRLDAKLLAEPDEGEYGGQTRFVTMKEIYEPQALMQRLKVELVKNFEGLILMTDGVSDALFATLANLRNARLWRELWYELNQIANKDHSRQELVEWLKFWSQGNHDDRTIALMLRDKILSIGPSILIK